MSEGGEAEGAATVRAEIRQAGARVYGSRLRGLRVSAGVSRAILRLSAGLAIAGPIVLSFRGELRPNLVEYIVGPGVILAVSGGLGGAGVSAFLATRRRERERARFRARLRDLTPDLQARVLARLSHEHLSDTRHLAGSLLREFGPASEVAPAPAAGGRGDEASAAGP